MSPRASRAPQRALPPTTSNFFRLASGLTDEPPRGATRRRLSVFAAAVLCAAALASAASAQQIARLSGDKTA
ncbi:MAG: hypothetical protein LC774_06520, partial [Acidobacteria bacterium]|nr:hypothetical protein [Acidobacteriota bacterium]